MGIGVTRAGVGLRFVKVPGSTNAHAVTWVVDRTRDLKVLDGPQAPPINRWVAKEWQREE